MRRVSVGEEKERRVSPSEGSSVPDRKKAAISPPFKAVYRKATVSADTARLQNHPTKVAYVPNLL